MGRTTTVNTDYFFISKIGPVLELLKTIRFSEKTNPIISQILSKDHISSNQFSDHKLLECFRDNRHGLQNAFLALSGKKSWETKHSDYYKGMCDADFLNFNDKIELLTQQTTSLYSLLDTLILSIETIVKYINSSKGILKEIQCLELFNVGFLPLFRIYGLPLTTFDHKKYTNADSFLGCHLEFSYVDQGMVLRLVNDFFKLYEDLTGTNIFDHEGLFPKIPRLYSYWGRALLFSTHYNEPANCSFKVFENENYMQLLYKNSNSNLLLNLDNHHFLIPLLRNTPSTTDISRRFNLNQAISFLNTSFCCEKPFADRYVLNPKDLKSKRNYIFEIGYGLLLEAAHIECKGSHIERNPLDAYLATDTLVNFYCHFGIEPIDSGLNSKRNVVGYGKPSQIKSELIHLFLNHVYVYLPKRLDTYQMDITERTELLADKTEKSHLSSEGYFQCNFMHQLKLLPNVLHLYQGFKPDHFGLPSEIEFDKRLNQYT